MVIRQPRQDGRFAAVEHKHVPGRSDVLVDEPGRKPHEASLVVARRGIHRGGGRYPVYFERSGRRDVDGGHRSASPDASDHRPSQFSNGLSTDHETGRLHPVPRSKGFL